MWVNYVLFLLIIILAAIVYYFLVSYAEKNSQTGTQTSDLSSEDGTLDFNNRTGVNSLVYFDNEARDNLAKKIEPVFDQIEDSWFSPTVSLEEFFEGNNFDGSIAANLWPQHPSNDEFYTFLNNIRAKDEVQNVLIGIRMVEEGEWPYSDTIFVISSARIETIQSWFEKLKPDAVEFCTPSSDSFRPYPFPETKAELQVAFIWWD